VIRFVYLDAAGTMLRPWPSVGELYVQACRPYGLAVSPGRAENVFRTIWESRVEAGDGGLIQAGTDEQAARRWWRTLVNEVLDALEFAGDRNGCFEACYEKFALPSSWHVYEEVRQVVSELRRLGLGVGVLSNWDARLPDLLEKLELAALFDAVVVSALEGCAKPDPAIFRQAAHRVGLPVGEILHVGDHPRLDLQAARRAGLHALLVDRRGTSGSDDVIPDLRGVPAWLIAGRHVGPEDDVDGGTGS
jgi:putative hydrolase of the HAD superfamily